MSFFAELKRRNVFRAATVYVAVAWLLIQVAETTFPAFGLDDAKLRILIVALVIGFIPAVALAWAFEITPEGVKRDRDRDNTIGRPDVAERIGRRLQSHDPLCRICAYQLVSAYALARRLTEALEVFSQLPEGALRYRLAGEAMALHSLGRREASRAALDALAVDADGAGAARRLAEVHAWLGEPEASAEWIRKSITSPHPGDMWSRYEVLASPFLDEVLRRPELQVDLRALGASREQLAAIRFEPRLPREP